MSSHEKQDLDLAIKIARAAIAECKRTFRENYENAGMSGLCEEGRWEAAFGSLDTIDINRIARSVRDESKK
jgi:hypothetical protein